MREFKYIKPDKVVLPQPVISFDRKIVLVVNDKHNIHHIKERGYVESPVRVKSILEEINKTGLFQQVEIKHFSENCMESVHDKELCNYFRNVCNLIGDNKSVYPYVFPIRNNAKPPRDLPMRAGYFCIDTFTPINKNAYIAAKRAVDCVLTCTDRLINGYRIAYALVRPPGHHAEHRSFGGFCYFNSAAVAAQNLSGFGKVAILDIDYHHGNDQQDIFYTRRDVMTVSIHGHPRFAYPFFSGFEDEKGKGKGNGIGFNHNFPLPEKVTCEQYHKTLQKAVDLIKAFKPKFLIVALGLDTAKGDPTGTWLLSAGDFLKSGRLIGQIKTPILCVQEGGYDNRVLGVNARNFFNGLWKEYNEYEKQ